MTETGELPLVGIKVLELAEGIAGPSATMYLADLGADVVKVETPEGDPARARGGFASHNRGKRSFLWDPGADGALDVLRRMTGAADAVLVDEPWLRRLREAGTSMETLASLSPAVFCALPYELTRVLNDALPLDDDAVAAASGLMWAQPGHEPGPVRLVFPVLSSLAGMLAASGILAGLLHRDRTGRTATAEVPLVAVSAMLVGLIGTTSDRVPRLEQIRTALGTHQTYRCYLARDGWLCIACTNPDFYSRFCLSLDLPELVTDERFSNAPWGVPL